MKGGYRPCIGLRRRRLTVPGSAQAQEVLVAGDELLWVPEVALVRELISVPNLPLVPAFFHEAGVAVVNTATAALKGACRRLPAVLARRFVGDALRRCYRWYERLR